MHKRYIDTCSYFKYVYSIHYPMDNIWYVKLVTSYDDIDVNQRLHLPNIDTIYSNATFQRVRDKFAQINNYLKLIGGDISRKQLQIASIQDILNVIVSDPKQLYPSYLAQCVSELFNIIGEDKNREIVYSYINSRLSTPASIQQYPNELVDGLIRLNTTENAMKTPDVDDYLKAKSNQREFKEAVLECFREFSMNPNSKGITKLNKLIND
jgi:hypothetical protein